MAVLCAILLHGTERIIFLALAVVGVLVLVVAASAGSKKETTKFGHPVVITLLAAGNLLPLAGIVLLLAGKPVIGIAVLAVAVPTTVIARIKFGTAMGQRKIELNKPK